MKISLMIGLCALLSAFTLAGQSAQFVQGGASVPQPPYIGQWSNGRGDTLAISMNTIKFANDKAVKFRDITRATNGREFNLEITSEGKLNYLTKFLHISMGEGDKSDEMKMTLYNSRKDMEDGANSQGEATWYRDK